MNTSLIRPLCYKTFFMLNSAEHEISLPPKILKNKDIFTLKLSDIVVIMLIIVKMPTRVGILTFMSMINFIVI